MMQLLIHVPAYRDRILERYAGTPLAINIERYIRSQNSKEFLSSEVDSQEIRRFLAETYDQGHGDGGRINPDADVQEDAGVPLMGILTSCHMGNRIRTTSSGSIENIETMLPLHIDRRPHGNMFTLQMNEYFRDNSLPGILISKMFLGGAPRDFMVMQSRFTTSIHPTTGAFQAEKYKGKVNFPGRYELPPEFVEGATNPTPYECDSFITHIGSSLLAGHYVAFIKKTDPNSGLETFWKCNDHTVTEIKQSRFQYEMRSAYLLHFQKLEV